MFIHYINVILWNWDIYVILCVTLSILSSSLSHFKLLCCTTDKNASSQNEWLYLTTFKQIFIMCKIHNYHIIIIKSFKASLLHKWHTHTNVGKQQNKPPFLPMALLSSHYSNLNSAPGEHVGDIYTLNAKPAAFTQFAYRRSVIELQTFLFVLLPLGTTADSASSSSYETASEHKQNTKAPQLGT